MKISSNRVVTTLNEVNFKSSLSDLDASKFKLNPKEEDAIKLTLSKERKSVSAVIEKSAYTKADVVRNPNSPQDIPGDKIQTPTQVSPPTLQPNPNQNKPGDANLDGRVDEQDLKILKGNLFTSGGLDRGDFNGDGLIDGSDFNIWNENRDGEQNNPNPQLPSIPSVASEPEFVPTKNTKLEEVNLTIQATPRVRRSRP